MIKHDDFSSLGLFPYLKSKFAPGGVKSSIFALTTAVVGAGLISLPLATYRSGIIFTLIQIVCAAILCVYSNMLLVITLLLI